MLAPFWQISWTGRPVSQKASVPRLNETAIGLNAAGLEVSCPSVALFHPCNSQ